MKIDKRERYSCECPICNNEFWACKSIFQEDFGMIDMGSGTCPKCNTHHNLTVDEENKRMIVIPYDIYVKAKELIKDEGQGSN